MSDWLLLGNDRNKKSYESSSEVCVFQKAVAFFLHLKKVPGPVGSLAPQAPTHTQAQTHTARGVLPNYRALRPLECRAPGTPSVAVCRCSGKGQWAPGVYLLCSQVCSSVPSEFTDKTQVQNEDA